MATDHETKIMQHCLRHGIVVRTLASGAKQFTGHGVSIVAHDIRDVSLANLRPYIPRKGHTLRNEWDQACAG